MGVDRQNESIRLRLLLGRLYFDGATPAQLTERYGIGADDVEAAWQFCQQRLSAQLAKFDGTEYRLLDEGELRSRAIECLRLLLDWRDALLTEARVLSFATPGSTPVDDDSELNSNDAVAKTD